MSAFKNLMAKFERKDEPPKVSPKPKPAGRSRIQEMQRQLETEESTVSPIKISKHSPSRNETKQAAPSTSAAFPNRTVSMPDQDSPKSPNQTTTLGSSSAQAPLSNPSLTRTNTDASNPAAKSAPATPNPPAVKPKPGLVRSSSMSAGIRQRLNTLGGGIPFNPMAGPRPRAKPKPSSPIREPSSSPSPMQTQSTRSTEHSPANSPALSRDDSLDTRPQPASASPSNGKVGKLAESLSLNMATSVGLMRRSNTIGSLASLKRQDNVAPSLPMLQRDQVKIANAEASFDSLPSHSLLGTNEGRARVRLGSTGARHRRLPSRRRKTDATSIAEVPIAGAAVPKAQPTTTSTEETSRISSNTSKQDASNAESVSGDEQFTGFADVSESTSPAVPETDA
eukprot:TRINITY_DN6007_c0_g1_i1.p1 TRINITY_DN6007_c0_g1~~TRINITY_DN6007_c0_g1_i1.p1  ORF type:complete len:395 (+),score=55.06 TRINITY_DN6007_c0_g1_i1:73-1257(+)